jgi:hypothetical protein
MDWGHYLEILALHGVGPQMLCLIRNFWDLQQTSVGQRETTADHSRPAAV